MSIDRTSPLKPVSTVQTRETSDTPVQKNASGKNVRRDERQRNVKRRASEAHAARRQRH
ncbi:negative regulator of flagellin synthesis (anti-sigma factor) [Salmonella enterica subsp. enterica serovar Dublin]|nr:negative regulator of flagellin synthesis (anti-sigma factor) [Salmonella enterica subsp. enterica serovar Dublin]